MNDIPASDNSGRNVVFLVARSIHLVRDGREVAHSLSRVEWWNEHVLWCDGHSPAQMEQAGEDRLRICARNWACEMKELHAGLSGISQERVLEVRYEQLIASPVEQLGTILRFPGLSVSADYQDAIESLQLAYWPGAWSVGWTPEQLECVVHEEQSLLSEYGYV